MPVKMISTRNCYIPSGQREVGPNQEFFAADEREAQRLTRQKRAKVVSEDKPAPIEPQATPAVARPKVLSLKDEASPEKSTPGGYSRRDMRAEGE